MARPRAKNEPSTYQPRPTVPNEISDRVTIVKAILGERMTISAAAEQLGIARVNMQTLAHRAESSIIEAMTPKPSGPTPKTTKERELEQELKRLERENAKLKEQLAAADDMMGAAGEIIRSLRGLPPMHSSRSSSPRSPRTSTPKTETSSEDSDPEPEPAAPSRISPSETIERALARIATAPEQASRAVAALGIGFPTLRRWLSRLANGEPLRRKRSGSPTPVSPSADQTIRSKVRALGELVGAESLARSVVGVSRRQAARIKQDELAAIERERKAECNHVDVTRAGVVRGFDAMYLETGYALVAADAHVPFRTSIVCAPAYDAHHVATALAADFERHGAPLVLRMDRASCHSAESVVSVLRKFGVIALNGPANYPRYYGQLERQNREHREWMKQHPVSDSCLSAMTIALNCLWRRRTLGWLTSEEVWHARLPLDDDRNQFLDEVHDRAGHLRARNLTPDLAMRLAIEQALINRGYLRITTSRQPLCE
jgi:transposase-like protein